MAPKQLACLKRLAERKNLVALANQPGAQQADPSEAVRSPWLAAQLEPYQAVLDASSITAVAVTPEEDTAVTFLSRRPSAQNLIISN